MKEVHVMLMENTAQLEDPSRLLFVFDLKGSTVDRKTKGVVKPSTTLKDQNYLLCCEQKWKQNKEFVSFKNSDRHRLITAMRKDVEFLKNQNLMDYSLLLCIEKRTNNFWINMSQKEWKYDKMN